MFNLLPLSLLLAAGNLFPLAGFLDDPAAWQTVPPDLAVAFFEEDGRGVARFSIPAEAEPGYPRLVQSFDAAPGEIFGAGVQARGEDTGGGYGVYMTLEFLDAAGQRLVYFQSDPAAADWSDLHVLALAPPEAVRGQICLLLNGHGTATFAAPELRRLARVPEAEAAETVQLHITDKPATETFLGFGFEDDGWFYNEDNAEAVDAEAVARHEARIDFMQPDLVRMFFWYQDWNPSGDWETFTWDSPNMRSRYRALDQYQRLGAAVNVTGVEWSMRTPFAEPTAMARALGALLEHLVKDLGYTCIRYWTLSNEPNVSFYRRGADFDTYREIHRLVRAEITRRGLDIQIVGSDDTSGLTWFRECVTDPGYWEVADVFASHQYLRREARPLAPWFFQERLALLAGRKPFIVAEFGFQDERSGTLENPLMREYPYALWTTAYVIEGLNQGVSGFIIWCLNEVYYPFGWFMNYGLWDYAPEWRLRPIFHAWANLTRLTAHGDAVWRTEASHPQQVLGATVGDVLFWVNQGTQAATVEVSGRMLKEVRGFTEATLPEAPGPGEALRVEGGRFQAPAESFGYARLEGEN